MSFTQPHPPLAVYYHTHWDREWYLPFRTYQVRLAEVVDEVLERLETGALPCFTLDGQTIVLADYLELRPANRSRLERLIQDGQISIGPWYVMPDEFLVGGESLIRNLMRGIREARAWGYESFTGYLPDTFGHSADMPAILAGVGIDSAILWRGANPRQSVFQWQSPNGAAVTTLHLTEGYFQMMLDDWTLSAPERQAALQNTVQKLQAATPPRISALLPVGADHMGPVPATGRQMLLTAYPQMQETTPDRYMASLNGAGQSETVTGELMDNTRAFLLPGVWSSRMYLKQANRRLEHMLAHRLEPLLAMTQALSPPEKRLRYPTEELSLAWQTLILNHPHDSICGCSVDAVHRENEVRFEQVRELGEAMQVRAERALGSLADAAHWVVMNTGSQPYTGVVPVTETVADEAVPTSITQVIQTETMLDDAYLDDPHRIPLAHLTQYRRQGWIWAEQVPAHGFKLIAKSAQPRFQPVAVRARHLENEYLAVTVADDGTVSITDKQTSQTHTGLGRIWIRPEQGDSYNSDPVPGAQPQILTCQGGSDSWGDGLLCGGLSLDYGPTFRVDISLSAGSPRLDFSVCIHSLPANSKVQVAFPTGQAIRCVTAESHLGTVQRRYDPAYQSIDQVPAGRMQELQTNTGPIQRFVSANGHSLITEGLTEYEVHQDTLYLTLLRTFSWLSARQLGTRGAPAGPPMPTPEGQYQAHLPAHMRFAWLPTPRHPERLFEEAGRFYGTVWAEGGTGASNAPQPETSLISWDNPALTACACYWLAERGLVLRLINPTGEIQQTTFQTGFAVRQIQKVNFLEEPQETLKAPELQLEPHGIQTLVFAV